MKKYLLLDHDFAEYPKSLKLFAGIIEATKKDYSLKVFNLNDCFLLSLDSMLFVEALRITAHYLLNEEEDTFDDPLDIENNK